MKRLLYIFMQLLLLTACSDDEQAGKDEKVYPDITVITPLGGMGDNGYNDSALSGLLETASEAGLMVSIQRPKNMEQAADCVRKWCDARQGTPRLLVLSDNEYGGLAKSLQTDEQNSVLLFEHDGKDLPSGIATFRISRYGVSYLSGCLAQGSEVARIIGGRKGDPAVEEAAKAFGEGYIAHNPQGEVIKHYLANDHAGWAMPTAHTGWRQSIMEISSSHWRKGLMQVYLNIRVKPRLFLCLSPAWMWTVHFTASVCRFRSS